MTQFEAQDYMGIILVRYKDNSVRYKELFKFLVSEMNENSNEFKECQRLIFENEGIKISGRTYLDYEELQQNGRQKYFDCLFSKDKFECLLKEFICLTGSNNITYEELQNQVFEFTHQRYDLQELIWGIIKCKFNDQHVKSFWNMLIGNLSLLMKFTAYWIKQLIFQFTLIRNKKVYLSILQ